MDVQIIEISKLTADNTAKDTTISELKTQLTKCQQENEFSTQLLSYVPHIRENNTSNYLNDERSSSILFESKFYNYLTSDFMQIATKPHANCRGQNPNIDKTLYDSLVTSLQENAYFDPGKMSHRAFFEKVNMLIDGILTNKRSVLQLFNDTQYIENLLILGTNISNFMYLFYIPEEDQSPTLASERSRLNKSQAKAQLDNEFITNKSQLDAFNTKLKQLFELYQTYIPVHRNLRKLEVSHTVDPNTKFKIVKTELINILASNNLDTNNRGVNDALQFLTDGLLDRDLTAKEGAEIVYNKFVNLQDDKTTVIKPRQEALNYTIIHLLFALTPDSGAPNNLVKEIIQGYMLMEAYLYPSSTNTDFIGMAKTNLANSRVSTSTPSLYVPIVEQKHPVKYLQRILQYLATSYDEHGDILTEARNDIRSHGPELTTAVNKFIQDFTL